MADARFFSSNGPFTLDEIALKTSSKLADGSKGDVKIENIAPLKGASEKSIAFFENPKYFSDLQNTQAAACFVSEKYSDKLPSSCTALVSAEPYRAYALLAQEFYSDLNDGAEFENINGAHIAKSAKIGTGTKIMPGAFIGANVEIGYNCYIGANTTITHSSLGDNVIIHRGSHIGADGFGFAMGTSHEKVPQLGSVKIENNVEIGNAVCIDRGSLKETHIGEGTKIDNLVQIGHNVQIGKHVVIVSQVGIAGSSEIGDYSVLGGQVGLAGHIKLGKNVQVAAGSGVPSDVEDGKIIGGYPAVGVRDWHRQTAILKKLVKEKKHV